MTDIAHLWRDDLVCVAIGCWFSMEEALPRRACGCGISSWAFRDRCSAPTRESVSASVHSASPLVVSMRPFAREDVAIVRRSRRGFPAFTAHRCMKANPAALGIGDIRAPDFGEEIDVLPHEVPLYWGCGLTAQAALEAAGFRSSSRTLRARCSSPTCAMKTLQIEHGLSG